jgi:hypothetical protein
MGNKKKEIRIIKNDSNKGIMPESNCAVLLR